MMLDELLPHLDGVRQRGTRWSARCPSHADRSPSLSLTVGERGILLKCWAGCSLMEICGSLGIEQRDLFFDALDLSPSRRREVALQRDRQRHFREHHAYQQGTLIDALREADYFIRSRRGLDISTWSGQKLDDHLNALADAYYLLEYEDLHG
jgi:hypothetical protein